MRVTAVVGLLAGIVVNFEGLPVFVQVACIVFAVGAMVTGPQALLVYLLSREEG